jgi:hypothetical protein
MSKGLKIQLACVAMLIGSLGSIAMREAIVRKWLPVQENIRQRFEQGSNYPFIGIASLAVIALVLRPIIVRGP